MQTIIMAGGKGTRIQSIASDIPKPMLQIDGVPVLEREIKSLVCQGFKEIWGVRNTKKSIKKIKKR